MADFRVQNTFEIPLYRCRIDLRAVMKGDALAQFEGIGPQIVGDIPFRRDAWCRLQIRGQIEQPLGRGGEGLGDVVNQVGMGIDAPGFRAGGKA